MDNGVEVLIETHDRTQMEAEMKATIKRECGEDNLIDRPLTGEEDEVSGDGCSDTTAIVDDMLLEGQKEPNLPLHPTSDGNNNEREDIRRPASLILASERETPSRSGEPEKTMLTLNKEPVDEPNPGDECPLEADEDATDLMTAICRVLPELQALNRTCERRHSCEFLLDPPTETRGSGLNCRRGTAPSLLFFSPQIACPPEEDDAQQISDSDGTRDVCVSHEVSRVESHPGMKEQNDSCSLQNIDDDGRAKETFSATSETLDMTNNNCDGSEHPAKVSVSDCGDRPGDQADAVVKQEANESEVKLDKLDKVEENPVPLVGDDTDQDYELEIAVGENQIEDPGETVPQPKDNDGLPAVHTTEGAPHVINEEPHYATVVKGKEVVPVPPVEAKYVNCQIPSIETQGGVSAQPEVKTENVEHVYDSPKVREGSGPANEEIHAPESSISGVCRQETGCEGAPATSEPIYETIEDGNERDNNNEGNGPDCGKATSCVVRRRCFCLVLGRLHVLPISRLVHLLAWCSLWWWYLFMLC